MIYIYRHRGSGGLGVEEARLPSLPALVIAEPQKFT